MSGVPLYPLTTTFHSESPSLTLKPCEDGPPAPQPDQPAMAYAADLTSGYILSAALLHNITATPASEQAFMECIARLAPACSGAGCSFTQCLIRQQGIAFTDPGPALLHGPRVWMLFNNGAMRGCMENALQMLVDDQADQHCRWVHCAGCAGLTMAAEWPPP